MMKKINYKSVLLIVIAASLIGLLHNSISLFGIPLIRTEQEVQWADTETLNESHSETDSVINAITMGQTLDLFESKEAMFIDARDMWEYGEGHIPGAISIPEFSFTPDDSVVATLNKDQLYVLYCESDDCDVSKRLANELSEIGFKKLFVFIGGYDEWTFNKLEIEK